MLSRVVINGGMNATMDHRKQIAPEHGAKYVTSEMTRDKSC